jgi:hypothetical protein
MPSTQTSRSDIDVSTSQYDGVGTNHTRVVNVNSRR